MFQNAKRDVTTRRVDVCSTANIAITTALNGGDTFNGVLLVEGVTEVLLTDQTDAKENGLWLAGAIPRRIFGFDTMQPLADALVYVQGGTTDHHTLWACTSARTGVVGTNNVTYAKLA